MNIVDITYIHDDVLSYIYSQTNINSESIDIYLSLIFEILQKQGTSLTYNTINGYLLTFIDIINKSTSEITTDNIQKIFAITENILQFGNFSLNYIQLVDNFFNTIIDIYSLNMMPGTTIANLQINNTLYFKTRLLSSNYSNFNLVLNDRTEISINKLQFDPNMVINLIISIYPQNNDYSSVVSIKFTNSGNYTNHTLYINPEETLVLNSSSIINILIPYDKNAINQWACLSYNEASWTEIGCNVIKEQKASVLTEVTLNSFFKLTDSSTMNHSSNEFFPVIIISSGITILTPIIYAILFMINQPRNVADSEGRSKIRLIFRYHMLFWCITPSPHLKNADRFLIYACILNTMLAIEGV